MSVVFLHYIMKTCIAIDYLQYMKLILRFTLRSPLLLGLNSMQTMVGRLFKTP